MIDYDPLERKELERLKVQLIAKFSPPLRPEEVERCVHSCMATFASARVRKYLALLIERAATEQLLAEVQLIEANARPAESCGARLERAHTVTSSSAESSFANVQ